MSQFIEMFGDPMVNDKQWSEYSCISEITQIVLGSTPNSKEPSYWDGDIRWITPAEMTDQSYYIFDTVRHITDEGRKAANLTVLPEGTVLFSTRAPIGKVAIVGKEMCCNQGFKNFICSEKLNNVFLYYTLKLKKDYLCSLGTGTTFKELSKRTVESLKIAVPPIELQNQFETIYNQADKSEFDGVKSQFIEMTGDPRTNPKGWPVKTLPELATYSIGLTYKPENISEDGTIVLRSGNIQNSKIDLGDTVRVNCPIKESIYVQKNDILMCSRNGSAALVGKVAMIKDIPEPMTYGAFMTVIRSEYSDYLYLYFQSNDFREQVSTGKSSTMNQITQNMLDKISLPLPDDETRKKLSIILHQADKSEFELRKSVEAIDKVIKSLINENL